MFFRASIAALILVFFTVLTFHTVADESASKQIRIDYGAFVAGIRELIAEGELAKAQKILEAVPPPAIDRQDILFLSGMVAAAQGRYGDAARLFERMLEKDPSLARPRLELARVYYQDGRYRAARRQFEKVLAHPDLPAGVTDNINEFLALIDKRRPWRVRLRAGILPDSNINTATDDETVSLIGLPFDLSDEARQQSGLGVEAMLGAGYTWRISRARQLRADTQFYRREYDGTLFDQTVIDGFFGIRTARDRTIWSLGATAQRYWFGKNGFRTTAGGVMTVKRAVGKRWLIEGSASGVAARYDNDAGRSGPVAAVTIAPTRRLRNGDTIGFRFGASREFARETYLRSTTFHGAINSTHVLPQSWAAELSVAGSVRPFDAVNPLFGERRRDTQVRLDARFMKRDLRVNGFIPVLTYDFTRNFSTIGLFDFTRNRGGVSFTRIF